MINMTEAEPRREITLGTIEERAARYTQARGELEAQITALAEEMDAIKRKHLRALRRLSSVVAEAEAELYNAIEVSPELFIKPRTAIFHGVKVGFTTGSGKVAFDDPDQVIKLIRKVFPDQAEVLIRSTEAPAKDALKLLDEADLRKVGCRLEDKGDLVVLKCVDGDIEKLVNKLIDKMVEAMTDGE
jgi:hypothetical protein